MLDLLLTLLNSIFVGFRSRVAMQAEIIALRNQLTVLQRNQKPKRLALHRRDRFQWALIPHGKSFFRF